jgi:hypothetical protein
MENNKNTLMRNDGRIERLCFKVDNAKRLNAPTTDIVADGIDAHVLGESMMQVADTHRSKLYSTQGISFCGGSDLSRGAPV